LDEWFHEAVFLDDVLSAPLSTYVLIEALGIASLAAVSYVSTNLDNLILLSAYGAKPGTRPLFVKLTFVFVCLTVLFVSLALARAADTLPTVDLRYLGLLPISLGGYQLVQMLKDRGGKKDSEPDKTFEAAGFAAYFGFALVLLANSGDSVSLMAPLFADLKPMFVLAGFTAAMMAAVLMSVLAGQLVRHPAARSFAETVGKWVLPFLLIGIGLLIFLDKPAAIFLDQ
jgi:cadmium resistance protein CadD (predicted permease)